MFELIVETTASAVDIAAYTSGWFGLHASFTPWKLSTIFFCNLEAVPTVTVLATEKIRLLRKSRKGLKRAYATTATTTAGINKLNPHKDERYASATAIARATANSNRSTSAFASNGCLSRK